VTLDLLSGGRLVVGAGLGSLAAEFTAFGESGDAGQRAARLDESLHLLDALWTGEPVTVRGQYLTAVDVTMLPRPVQQPRIPVWCGGRWPNKAPFRRAARWDGVMPTHVSYGLGETMPPDELTAAVQYTAHQFPAPCINATADARIPAGRLPEIHKRTICARPQGCRTFL
jgi:alkanesulfonate monooxygenase SsuD/methylene tetrahydromethanopterin reductase-like flavin-dependent oxidoreductase (luciferase family)